MSTNDRPLPPVRQRTRNARPPYEIGYGKPPERSRFKPGQSGNPKGRPKGARSLKTIVHEVLGEKISVRTNGKERRVSRLEALILRQVELAVKGNMRALEKLLQLHMTLAPVSEPEKVLGPTGLSETDEAALQELARVVAIVGVDAFSSSKSGR